MGGLLIEAFVHSGALRPDQIAAHSRTKSKTDALASSYPGLQSVDSNGRVAEISDIIFICVKPMEFKPVLEEIGELLPAHKLVVSITSPVSIVQLEDKLDCKIAKVIPSITNRLSNGATLCMYGERMSEADKERLEQLLEYIGKPLRISEQHVRAASDLSSCGPAFLAYFLEKLAEAASEQTGLPREQADELVAQMALGTGRLLTDGGMTAQELQARVAVPGGITAEALRLLASELDGVFGRLIHITHAKYYEDIEKLNIQFADREDELSPPSRPNWQDR
jgi:competence protein ComER